MSPQRLPAASPSSATDNAEECIRSKQRARLILTEMAIPNFVTNLAVKASSPQKAVVTAPTPVVTPMRRTRPKLERRDASYSVPLLEKPFGFTTIFDDQSEKVSLDAGIVTSPPATKTVHEWKGRATADVNVTVEAIESDDDIDDETKVALTAAMIHSQSANETAHEWKGRATANVNVTVDAIESDDENDDEDGADLDSNEHHGRIKDKETAASCVEFVEFVEDVHAVLGLGSHPIDAGAGTDYRSHVTQAKVEEVSKATVTISEIPVSFRRHRRRGKHGWMACYKYHMLDTIVELPSPALPSSFSFSSESSSSSDSSTASASSSPDLSASNITITLHPPHEDHSDKKILFPIVLPKILVTPSTPTDNSNPFARVFAAAVRV